MKQVLVVEDNALIRKTIEKSLTDAGFKVTATDTVAKALGLAQTNRFDLATVDVVLDDGDGLELTRTLRERFGMGVVIVSGLRETTERVVGLEVGADDYLTKPFSPRELIARARSVLRRLDERRSPSDRAESETFLFEGWKLNTASRELYDPDSKPVVLTSGEYKLLEVLVTRPNRVISRDQLLDLVCTDHMPVYDRSIDVRVARLRRKLSGESKTAAMIKTIRNGGYIFSARVIAA